jgi:hypothetical protein
LILLFGLFECSTELSGQITLHTDFPSASLDVAQSEVDGTGVKLVGSATWTDWPGKYRWVHFRASGVEGVLPMFQIGRSGNTFLGDLRGHDFHYSYDRQDWKPFDNSDFVPGSFLTRESLTFYNDAAFTAEDVYVAYSVPYTFERTEAKMAKWSGSSYVGPTTSADMALTIGTVANTTAFGPSDLSLYGFSVADEGLRGNPAQRPKVVLMSGNHSGEHAGNWAFEGTVDFLLSDDPRAARLRETAEILVYPQIDPLGRVEGYYRGNSQNPAADHNRAWDPLNNPDHSGFTEIGIVHEAILTDTASEAFDIIVDYHGFFDTGPNYVLTEQATVHTHFMTTLRELEPQLDTRVFETLQIDLDSTGVFAFDAAERYAPEFSAGDTIDDLRLMGENYAIALYGALVDPLPGDFIRDGILNATDIDLLSAAVGSDDLIFDLNVDGAVDQLDRGVWITDLKNTLVGDADLNRRVEFADFLTMAAWFGQPGGWAAGDFDGDAFVGFPDFLALAANFGTSVETAVAVPEPALATWAALAFIVAWRRRRRD